MNVTASAQTPAATAGAHAKHGKGGDPLADFMALLGQLGITVDGDGTITEGGATTTAAGPNDLAAKLIAKLAKKVEGATDGQSEAPKEGEAEGDESKQESLTDLLAPIVPATSDAVPQKLDIASLLAAVRAFAAASAKPEKAPTETGEAKAVAATESQASSIAALLARTTRAVGTGASATPSPGAVQSAFNHLEAQMAASAQGAPVRVETEETQPDATDAGKSDSVPLDKAAIQPQNAAITKLTELLARMTASSKPGAAQPPLPAATAPVAANTAQTQIVPQLAALAQAMQQVKKDDQPTQAAPDAAISTTPLGMTPVPTPAPTARADGAQMVATPTPADEMMTHHLDLAKDAQWLDTLARDIARAANSESHMRFQLSPEHLGTLKVELLNGSNGTSVKLTTETEAARQILADAQPKLVAEARAQGLRISEAQVNLGGQGGGQRHMAEQQQPVVIRTAGGSSIAEVEQDRPGASGERYA